MRISIIIPAYNAAPTLPRCLQALQQESSEGTEIIVVDDCSTDDTAAIAEKMGARVLRTSKRGGPAAARNLGAELASGEILFFVDADVSVQESSVRLVREVFEKDPQVAAVFGSYDDQPAESNFLSQYKNLLHHFVHQKSSVDAETFWAGCGAVRKDIFALMRGFNADLYPNPSIEDIELGLRLKREKHSILLEKQLQGKHLKKWTALSLLKADILHRAYPWSRLIAETGQVPDQLNLQFSHRISALLSACFFALGPVALFLQLWPLLLVAAAFLAVVIYLNRDLYAFFAQKRGILFLPGAILWHMSYYVYSAMIFVYCWIRFRIFHHGTNPSLQAQNRSL